MIFLERNSVVIIFGVSGCGKTTIGKLLSKALKVPFYDADDFHPKANIEKMKSGRPLDDEDRYPWLSAMAESIAKWNKETGAVLACSALKESYRKILAKNNEIDWIFLSGSYDTIFERMKNRKHFMKADMLQSQFDALEVPAYGYHVDIRQGPNSIITNIMKQLGHE